MEEPYNLSYHTGDHLVIELHAQQIFEGDFCDAGKNRIDLVNVRQHNNTNELGGVYSFYRNEIRNIYIHKRNISEVVEKSKPVSKDCSNSIQVVEEEYMRLKQMCKDAIYLEQVDDRYFKSVEKLSDAETVGVISLGSEESAIDILRLLVVCTWKQVYIFDLINIRNRKFFPELKYILESEYVTKVIHGGSAFINSLHKNYNVYVQNVFNTQIVDLILERNRTGGCPTTMLDLSECLVKYLNFPPSLLKEALAVPKKGWIERPLCDEKKVFAAQLVAYLIPLKDYMNKNLLRNVYKAIDDVHSLYFDLDNYEFSRITKTNKVTEDIASLIPKISVTLNLDEEKNEDKT